jgi:hypothetical protein
MEAYLPVGSFRYCSPNLFFVVKDSSDISHHISFLFKMRNALVLLLSITALSSVSADVCSECTWLKSDKAYSPTKVDLNIRAMTSIQIQQALLLLREPFTSDEVTSIRESISNIVSARAILRLIEMGAHVVFALMGNERQAIYTRESYLDLTDEDRDDPYIARVLAVVGVPLALADANVLKALKSIFDHLDGTTCYDYIAMEEWYASRSEALTATRVDLQYLLPVDVTDKIGGFLRGDKDDLTDVARPIKSKYEKYKEAAPLLVMFLVYAMALIMKQLF